MKQLTILVFIFSIFIHQHILAQSNSNFKHNKNIFKHQDQNAKLLLGNNYNFSYTTQPYSDLVGATSVNNDSLWDDPEYIIPIGFSFKLYGKTIDTLYIGYGFGGTFSDKYTDNVDPEFFILPLEADLIDRGYISGTSLSPISYKLQGAVGNRVLKIEYKNAGFYTEGDSLGTYNDYVNFQTWIYEGSNKIEFHYGASQINNPNLDYEDENGAIIGMADLDFSDFYLLVGPVSNPTLTTNSSQVFINGTPANGTVYIFDNTYVGIDKANKNTITSKVIPNPISEYAYITFSTKPSTSARLNIYNISGKKVKSISDINTNSIKIEKAHLNSGLYFYQLKSDNEIINTGKFIIQ